jgi:hypothetical protein
MVHNGADSVEPLVQPSFICPSGGPDLAIAMSIEPSQRTQDQHGSSFAQQHSHAYVTVIAQVQIPCYASNGGPQLAYMVAWYPARSAGAVTLPAVSKVLWVRLFDATEKV